MNNFSNKIKEIFSNQLVVQKLYKKGKQERKIKKIGDFLVVALPITFGWFIFSLFGTPLVGAIAAIPISLLQKN